MLFADADLATAAVALRTLHVEDLLIPVLTQLVVIIAAARLAGVAARRLGQPTVVGEVVAGLMLGPSLFGALFPDLFAAVFQPQLPGVEPALTAAAFPKIFEVLKELGLIFLLFLIGLEFEFGHLRQYGRAALLISVAGIALPFALGVGLAPLVHPYLEDGPRGGPVPRFGMTLFLGVAMSITAIPVLGRIMIEMGVTRTRLGAIVITAAAADDACGWILLATVSALARVGTEGYDPLDTVLMAGLTVAFAAFMFLALRPLLVRYFRWSMAAHNGHLSLTAMAVLLVVLLGCAIATGRIGVFAVYGAFLLGAALSDQEAFRQEVSARMRDFVGTFFLPIFFTYTGLRTELSALGGPAGWLICLAVTAAAVVGKVGGCGLAARLSGFPAREAASIGAMMSTRGLMALIVINVGFDLGVIPKSLFCTLVVMAVVTTMLTTPLLLALRRGTELEGPIERSWFRGRAATPEPAGAA